MRKRDVSRVAKVDGGNFSDDAWLSLRLLVSPTDLRKMKVMTTDFVNSTEIIFDTKQPSRIYISNEQYGNKLLPDQRDALPFH